MRNHATRRLVQRLGWQDGAERQIFNNLLGPEGVLRRPKTTVVLVNNFTHHIPAADHVLLLGESRL